MLRDDNSQTELHHPFQEHEQTFHLITLQVELSTWYSYQRERNEKSHLPFFLKNGYDFLSALQIPHRPHLSNPEAGFSTFYHASWKASFQCVVISFLKMYL